MPELWNMVAKEMVFCPYCGEKMPAVTVDEEETPGDDTEDVTLREEEASLFEEEAVKGDAARSQEAVKGDAARSQEAAEEEA